MMRIFLFLATNLAVLVIASITLKLLGVDRYTGQNYGSLLVFCAVFGFAGSLISLFISVDGEDEHTHGDHQPAAHPP